MEKEAAHRDFAVRFFATPAEFRKWLGANHDRVQELWVGFRKKASGQPTITYPEALDEALCVGWIDGVRRTINDTSYTMRFTPRKPKSVWSAVNIKRAHELIAQGRMRPPGISAFEKRDEARAKEYSYERAVRCFDGQCESAFRANAQAWKFFQAQPAGYRRLNTWWVMSAKREDTRTKRLAVVIEASGRGIRLDPMK